MSEFDLLQLRGRYVSGWQSASGHWLEDIVANQREALPNIEAFYPGTLNVRLSEPAEFVPWDIPLMRRKRDRSCISQVARVVSINGVDVDGHIYNGGWPGHTIELLCEQNLSKLLGIDHGDWLTLEVRQEKQRG